MPLDEKLKGDFPEDEKLLFQEEVLEDKQTKFVNLEESQLEGKVQEPDNYQDGLVNEETTTMNVQQKDLLKQVIVEANSQLETDLAAKFEESVLLIQKSFEDAYKEGADNEESSAQLKEMFDQIVFNQNRNDKRLLQVLGENALFQKQVRQGMQKDIDQLKKELEGESDPFVDLVTGLATMYTDYLFITEEPDDDIDKLKNNLKSLFSTMEELLEEFDIEIYSSSVGEERKPRFTKIIEKVIGDDETKHNTIVKSRKPGINRGKRVIIPEYVDVYVFDPAQRSEVTEEK